MKEVFLDDESETQIQSYLDSNNLLSTEEIQIGENTEHPVTSGQIDKYGYSVGDTVGLIYNRRNTGNHFLIKEIRPGTMGWGSYNMYRLLIERVS